MSLAMKLNTYHVINDPIHGAMQFKQHEMSWLKPFIDNPVMQRLRHIKQLGFADLLFPGAVHSRFNHSLGCCYVASQIADKIELDAHDKQIVTIAGLLHDIGHGPFSHAFEEIFTQHKIRHENWTPYFLQEFYSDEFLTLYNKKNPDFPLQEEQLSIIRKMIMHEETEHKLLADIVSSQLDADRLDYLLRDSHFCGVKYGEFDFRWLLHCLVAVENQGYKRLGVTFKGIGVVENYLIARRLMIRNIYYHYKKYAAELMLREFLSQLSLALTTEKQLETIKTQPIGQFLGNVRKFNESSITEKNKEALTQQFLQENYHLYKHLCDYDVFMLIRELANSNINHPAVKIAKKLQSRQLPKVFSLDAKQYEWVQERVNSILSNPQNNIQSWQLATLNPPHHSYLSKDRIKILDDQGNIKNIDECSFIIKALLDKVETSCCLIIDKEVLEAPPIQQLLQDL